MTDIVALADAFLGGFMDPLPRTVFWGALSGIISMGIYALVSPQDKLCAARQLQKDVRAQLMKHEGKFGELKALIRKDLSLSLKQCAYAIPAVLISAAPTVGLLFYLYPALGSMAYPAFGPDWTGSFEFWYISAALLGSLATKFLFKIA